MAKFVHVRDLKNQTTALLREVEAGTTLRPKNCWHPWRRDQQRERR